MQQYRLKCECGYESNPAPYGADAWSTSFYVPVVVHDDEQLQKIEIMKLDNESEDAFDERLDSTIESESTKRFGQSVTTMTPLAVRGEQVVKCPICKKEEAKFEFVGF